jgi:hypothetical protein
MNKSTIFTFVFLYTTSIFSFTQNRDHYRQCVKDGVTELIRLVKSCDPSALAHKKDLEAFLDVSLSETQFFILTTWMKSGCIMSDAEYYTHPEIAQLILALQLSQFQNDNRFRNRITQNPFK